MTQAPKERAALAGSPISDSNALVKQDDNGMTAEVIQHRRLCRLYRLSAATAITVAELAFAGCPR